MSKRTRGGEATYTDTDNTEAGGGPFTLTMLREDNGDNLSEKHYTTLAALQPGASVTLDLGAGGLVTYTRVS